MQLSNWRGQYSIQASADQMSNAQRVKRLNSVGLFFDAGKRAVPAAWAAHRGKRGGGGWPVEEAEEERVMRGTRHTLALARWMLGTQVEDPVCQIHGSKHMVLLQTILTEIRPRPRTTAAVFR